MKPLQTGELAVLFGFERSYLYRLFKKKTEVGIKEYLTDVRMERACEFLKNGFGMGETAHLGGYADEFNFSRAFKARCDCSPLTFVKKALIFLLFIICRKLCGLLRTNTLLIVII